MNTQNKHKNYAIILDKQYFVGLECANILTWLCTTTCFYIETTKVNKYMLEWIALAADNIFIL